MPILGDQFDRPYMRQLREFLRERKQAGAVIYPPGSEIFNALNLTGPDRVKVVIIGQDPYHQPGQAHGLCFSVKPGVTPPPSLQNIFKEIESDLGIPPPDHGFLEDWARQGVLLLNAVLTVEQGNPGSHRDKGWEQFTDRVIEYLGRDRSRIVFLLWGSFAQKKGRLIDRQVNEVLEAPHPSPLSAHRGFFGCRHFSRANRYLAAHGKVPIDWSLPALD